MLKTEEIQRLKGLAMEIADREGCVVYDLEFASGGQGQGRILRVYIDKDQEGGVSLEDCSNVSKALNLRLDVEDVVPGGAYVLEVSSPGLDRALREPWHFHKVVGQRVWLKSNESMVPAPAVRRQVTGDLIAASETDVSVRFDGGELTIPYTNIERANVIFEVTTKAGPPAKVKKKKK